MFIVYVLESQKDQGWYIGFTTNLKNRLFYHNSGRNTYTKFRRPFKLIYAEAYLNKRDALERERFLKSGAGRMFLKKQMKWYLASINE